MSVSVAIYRLFDLIMLLMLIKIFLTWIPNINWFAQPLRFLNDFTEAIFSPFRKILPPFGMLDLSPILAFIVMRIVQVGIFKLLVYVGL